MVENTNRTILVNSLVLYGKIAITTFCSIFATRFALQALGNVDYGLYSVLGGIISFVAIFNTIMLSSTNRFIAVALGKGDLEEVNKQFNVCLVIHIVIAIVTLLLATSFGEWYINRYINYEGNISDAIKVFNISIIGSVISFVGVPYNGVLMAKEKFIVFSSIDIVVSVIKLIISYLLIGYFQDKLLIYATTMSILTVVPILIYWIYCRIKFFDIVKINIVLEKSRYKEIFDFSAWMSLGAVSYVCKNQGSALLVNAFFNTILNTSLGLANTINGYISLFAQNVTQPMAPQIMKNYASGNKERVDNLLVMSTKFAFLAMFIISVPFLIEPEAIIKLWLGSVPPYVVIFTVLLVVDNLIQSLNSGINNVIFASGKISLYQLSVSALNVLSIVLAYFALKVGCPVYCLVVAYIVVSILKFFLVQYILHKTLNYNNEMLIRKSYLPSLSVVLLSLPLLVLKGHFNPLPSFIIAMVYVCAVILFIGLNNNERQYLMSTIYKMMRRCV